jgi:hypothetical protein
MSSDPINPHFGCLGRSPKLDVLGRFETIGGREDRAATPPALSRRECVLPAVADASS